MSDDAEYRCFVGGLSWSTSDKVLREEFDRFVGLIDAKVVVDGESGRSREFGFVTFNDRQSIEDAIEKMRGIELDGRNFTVEKAQLQGQGRDCDGGRDRDRGRDREYGGGGHGSGGGECFKCGLPGHFARECPERDRGGSRYGGGGGGGGHVGPDRNGDRYGGRSKDGGGYGGGDRYSPDRSGPYERR